MILLYLLGILNITISTEWHYSTLLDDLFDEIGETAICCGLCICAL